jgi:single-strand DNA-binding protein
MNKIVITGRWTKDIELRQVQTTHLAKSTIAVDDGYGDKKLTYFFDVDIWGKQAENVTKFSGKGRKVLIEGRLRQETYEKEGQKKTVVKIVAESIEFLDAPKPTDHLAPPEGTPYNGKVPF